MPCGEEEGFRPIHAQARLVLNTEPAGRARAHGVPPSPCPTSRPGSPEYDDLSWSASLLVRGGSERRWLRTPEVDFLPVRRPTDLVPKPAGRARSPDASAPPPLFGSDQTLTIGGAILRCTRTLKVLGGTDLCDALVESSTPRPFSSLSHHRFSIASTTLHRLQQRSCRP